MAMSRITGETWIWSGIVIVWLLVTVMVTRNAGDMMEFFGAQPLLSWSNQVLLDFYLTALVVLAFILPDARARGVGSIGIIILVILTLGLGAFLPLAYMIWRSLKPAVSQ